MNFPILLLNGLWASLFAIGWGVLLTAPLRYLLPTVVCGFAGRFIRDVVMGLGVSQNWSTVIAVAALVLVAAALTQRHRLPPVVLICAILPLGAAGPVFNIIFELMKVSSLQGAELGAASDALIANSGKALTGTLAIALGLGAGMAIVRLFRPEAADAV